jgi:hypothetical protein
VGDVLEVARAMIDTSDLTDKVFTAGDKDQMLWVLGPASDDSWYAIAMFGRIKNKPNVKVFITNLNNKRRAEVDDEQARDFKDLCTKLVVNELNERGRTKGARMEIVRQWLPKSRILVQ